MSEKLLDFETFEVISDDGLVMVELEWIGEGIDGDYDHEDSGDIPLLRYTVYRKYESNLDNDKLAESFDLDAYEDGDWMQVNDSSYCTQLDVRTDREILTNKAKEILNEVESGVRDLSRQKRLYESLSWISSE